MLSERLKKRLQQHENAQLIRTRRIADRKTISFCSNDYLGLSQHPDVIAAFCKAACQYGTSGDSSVVVNGYTKVHQALEEDLAEFTNRPRAVLFSTGYMANVGVLTALLDSESTVFADKLSHASLVDGARFSGAKLRRYRHNDLQHLETLLKAYSTEQQIIVSDGVFSMDGDRAPLKALSELAKQYTAWLMVDDAHSFGVIGNAGQGCVFQEKLKVEDVQIVVGAFGKAFGTMGGFVAGDDILIESIIQFARSYIYTTAMPAAIAAATRTSLRLMQRETWRRDHLNKVVERFRSGAEKIGLPTLSSTTPIQSIILKSPEKVLNWGEKLRSKNILVGVMRPPTVPPNTDRLRITFNANHKFHDVDRLLSTLEKIQAQEEQ